LAAEERVHHNSRPWAAEANDRAPAPSRRVHRASARGRRLRNAQLHLRLIAAGVNARAPSAESTVAAEAREAIATAGRTVAEVVVSAAADAEEAGVAVEGADKQSLVWNFLLVCERRTQNDFSGEGNGLF